MLHDIFVTKSILMALNTHLLGKGDKSTTRQQMYFGPFLVSWNRKLFILSWPRIDAQKWLLYVVVLRRRLFARLAVKTSQMLLRVFVPLLFLDTCYPRSSYESS